MKLSILVAGVAGAILLGTAARAADPIVIPPPAPPPPMIVSPAGFDWAGPYAGATYLRAADPAYGGQVGFNFIRGNFVGGAELALLNSPGNGWVLVLSGKAGIPLGATGRALLYGTAGYIMQLGPAPDFLVAGVGLALALGDRVSIFGEGLTTIGFGCCVIRAGINFHLGD